MIRLHMHRSVPTEPAPVVVPEDDVVFRAAQMLLLLVSLQMAGHPGISLERLGYYDFLVANPLLVLTDEADPDRTRLLMAGFDCRALSYASPAHRFTTRRQRLQHDLAWLVTYGLVEPSVNRSVQYAATSTGVDLAGQFTAAYAEAYRLSASVLVGRLRRLTDKRLREQIRVWTSVGGRSPRAESLNLIDLVDLDNEGAAVDGQAT